jgi:hypothetical protein
MTPALALHVHMMTLRSIVDASNFPSRRFIVSRKTNMELSSPIKYTTMLVLKRQDVFASGSRSPSNLRRWAPYRSHTRPIFRRDTWGLLSLERRAQSYLHRLSSRTRDPISSHRHKNLPLIATNSFPVAKGTTLREPLIIKQSRQEIRDSMLFNPRCRKAFGERCKQQCGFVETLNSKRNIEMSALFEMFENHTQENYIFSNFHAKT